MSGLGRHFFDFVIDMLFENKRDLCRWIFAERLDDFNLQLSEGGSFEKPAGVEHFGEERRRRRDDVFGQGVDQGFLDVEVEVEQPVFPQHGYQFC